LTPEVVAPERAVLQTPHLGPLYMHRIIRPGITQPEGASLLVDLGFGNYLDAAQFKSGKLEPEDIVRSAPEPEGGFRLARVTDQIRRLPFTFKAYVERVVDGDTLRVFIILGLGGWTRQYLRLRAIDTPELKTKEGKAARDFVVRELQDEPFVTIKSTRPGKYDRYLADVFYGKNHYLNQRLLDSGHAVLVPRLP